MENNNGSFFGNLFIFVGGFFSSYNIFIAVRNFRYGPKFEELLKENADLKKEVHELENDIIGKEAIINAYKQRLKENDTNTKGRP